MELKLYKKIVCLLGLMGAGVVFAEEEENNVPPTETEAAAPKKFGEKAKRGEWEAGLLRRPNSRFVTPRS